MQLRQVHLSLIALAVLVGWLCVGQVAAAARPTDGSGPNRVLLAAASPLEDLTEFALANDTPGMRQALKAYDDQAAAVNQVLSPQARLEMASLLTRIRQAEQKGDNQSVALNAVEAYRVLVESLDPNGLVVPIQVSRLDYSGFKLKVLLAATPPDWSAIQKTVEAAGGQWYALEPRVGDKALRDAVKTVIAGLNQATSANNLEMAVFAAQMDLALVDLLEGYFERAAP
jgi:hypothetical protein